MGRDPLSVDAEWLGNDHSYGLAQPTRVTDPRGLCGYFGDPGDPWCKEQKPPEENVNDEWKKPKTDGDAKLQFIYDGVRKLIEEYANAKRNETESYRTLGALFDSFFEWGNDQLLACARDLVCQYAVPVVMIGAFLIASVFQPEVLA